MSANIESYAMIGNCRTAALVGLDGSIDWLCLPDFSSGAVFASLLGTRENGRWRIAPVSGLPTERKYRGDTMILETSFQTPEGGAVTLVDFMPSPASDGTDPIELVRIVRGIRGTVRMKLDITFRFDYGRVKPWLQQIKGGIRATAGPDSLRLSSTVPFRPDDAHHISEFDVREGEEIAFVLTHFPSHRPPPPEIDPRHEERKTERFWTDWANQFKARNPWRKFVMRSLLTLKAMVFHPTGGIVAAPTTSLPEQLGGKRNWDYRFCWIRDATLTLYALVHAGYHEEAEAWRQWLLRAAAGDPSDLQIMYGIYGNRRLTEMNLDWLPGYENSKPVRLGNQAHSQFQLDVFGEMLGVLHVGRHVKGLADIFVDGWHLQLALMRFLKENWNKPDRGIWEVRGEPRQFTHSKTMAWLAVDRSIKDAEKYHLEGPIEEWKSLRKQIHDEVCARGFHKRLNSFTEYFDGDTLDAALLMIPRTGFLPAKDPRFLGTVAAIERDLLIDKTFVLRYKSHAAVDGVEGHDNAFLPCCFWLAEAYALIGRRDDAVALFERLLALCNDVGLLSEEYDYKSRRMVGNFPQAFTHVALISTAALLAGETEWLPIE